MTRFQKLRFIFSYAWAKLLVPFETRSPRWLLTYYEFLYSLSNLLRTLRPKWDWVPVWKFKPNQITSRFGRFQIRRGTQDASIVSPAFERADLLRFLEEARLSLATPSSRLMILDIGAHLGKFSIASVLALRGKSIRCMAFEPHAETYKLLEKNRALNGISEIELPLVEAAVAHVSEKVILSTDPLATGNATLGDGQVHRKQTQSTVQALRLDELNLLPMKGESLLIKMDIEGAEVHALHGAQKMLAQFSNVGLLIEDMDRGPELSEFLNQMGLVRQWKISPYNSFWRRC